MRQHPVEHDHSVQPGQVEQWILQRTSGRVKNLSVECAGDRVIVHGRAGSYYHKQLALAAALEAVDPDWLVFEVDVSPVRAEI